MANPQQVGAFVPTTNIWDVQSLYNASLTDENVLRELLVRLYQNINNISLVLNIKDSGYYDTKEFVNGQLYYPNPNSTSISPVGIRYRQVFRKVIDFGSLPNAGITSVPHGISITGQTTFTRIYGTANDLTNMSYIPLPYTSNVANSNIELYVDAINVNIATGVNYSTYTTTYIVLEYLQF